MNPSIASFVYTCGIAGLFYLDRDKSIRTSKALWLPVIYLWVIGSRPVSEWLGIGPAAGTDVQLDGSPVDRLFFAALLIAAICCSCPSGTPGIHLSQRKFADSDLFLFLSCEHSLVRFPGRGVQTMDQGDRGCADDSHCCNR